MSKRIFLVIFISCVFVFVATWIVHVLTPKNDERRFQTLRRASDSYSRALAFEHGRWGGLLSILHRSDHFLNTYKAEREELFTSGFLTNLTFTIPADGARRDEWIRQEVVLTHGTNVEVAFPIVSRDGEETITCRTSDAAFLRHTLGE